MATLAARALSPASRLVQNMACRRVPLLLQSASASAAAVSECLCCCIHVKRALILTAWRCCAATLTDLLKYRPAGAVAARRQVCAGRASCLSTAGIPVEVGQQWCDTLSSSPACVASNRVLGHKDIQHCFQNTLSVPGNKVYKQSDDWCRGKCCQLCLVSSLCHGSYPLDI